MRKSTNATRPAKQTRSRGSGSRQEANIAEALKDINRLTPDSAKAAQAITLLKSWLKDESGYDEKTWPKLKKALDQQRAKVDARRLFDE